MILACAFFSYAMAVVAVVADVTYPPCVFNPLCQCSRSDAHLAVVVCNGVPLAKLPTYLNRSKINNLQISDNGLRKIDEYFLSGSGKSSSSAIAPLPGCDFVRFPFLQDYTC